MTYDVIIPSREDILAALGREGVPVPQSRLEELLGIDEAQLDGFTRRLAAMIRDGQILRNRRDAILLPDKADLVAGRVEAHADGHGFVRTPTGERLYLNQKQMNEVLHGDRVMVRPLGVDRRGRREASVVEVLGRAQQRVVGRLHEERGVRFVVASDRRISQDILIEPDGAGRAKPGMVVTVELTAQPTRYMQPIGRIVEVLGEATDPGMEIEIALRKHQLPFEFSKAALRDTKKLPETVRAEDAAGRTDLRAEPFVTIDGETAKDFDDAVFCRPTSRGWKLFVAIADVSHYVRDGEPLDEDARMRSTSVYFPRRVIPMLPEELSNGLCSLNPDVDRLAVVCEIDVSRGGKIGEYRFYDAVFRSHARLTYTRVANALYATPPDSAAVPAPLLPHLRHLDDVFRALEKTRATRGAIDFDTPETEFEFGEDGKIHGIRPSSRNDAHRLIEECMLAANVCAADYLIANGQPALFRIHEGPTAEKLENLRQFLRGIGLVLGGGDEPTAKHYASLLDSVRHREDAGLLQTVLLRSLSQAVYSPENVGHFGLAYPAYAHFTSPIRRYPDLLVHRGIKAVIRGERYVPVRYGDAPAGWADLADHCSFAERRADDASRDVLQWLKCFYMQDRTGEVFDGVISAVTGFGVFVTLDALFVDGLIHVSELGQDYFTFDAIRHELRGGRTNQVFRLGDRMRVQVVRVDMDRTRIDFLPAGDAPVGAGRK
jgi:ribonuclease R